MLALAIALLTEPPTSTPDLAARVREELCTAWAPAGFGRRRPAAPPPVLH